MINPDVSLRFYETSASGYLLGRCKIWVKKSPKGYPTASPLSSFSTGGYFEKGLNFVFLTVLSRATLRKLRGRKVVAPSLRFIQSPAQLQ